jgi:hypothetical protein
MICVIPQNTVVRQASVAQLQQKIFQKAVQGVPVPVLLVSVANHHRAI